MQVRDCHALRCAHGMFLLNAVKLISVRARRFPGPPDGARPAVARAERLLRTRRRLARAVSLLTHRSRAGLLKASSTPRRSLCFHLSFSHSRARNCSLRFDLRIAKRAGGGGGPARFSPSAYHDFKHFHHPRKFPHLPPCPCGRAQCTFCVLTVFPLRTKQAFPGLPRRTLS